MYERQHGGDLEVGSYAHRPILLESDDIPSIAASALSPTELPFTQEDFELQLEQALELVPDILGDESVGIRHAINGVLSLTPDGMPVLGETPEVKGLWSCAAIWIKEAPGHRQGRRRVDDPRHLRDRPPRLGHRPLLRPPEDEAAHRCPQRRGVQQDLRHRPPDGAVGVEPRRAPEPGLEPPAGARRGLLRGGRLGATVLVRGQRGPGRRVRRPRDAAPRRVGRALVVADHQRRAPRDARRRRHGRPGGVRHLRCHRPGRPRLPAGARRQPDGRRRSAGPCTRRSCPRTAGSSRT